MGPTGIGKSALAMALARRVPAEIVSVDSAMVYRGMDIGTAKPSAADRARVRHHLLDIRDPAETYSAAEFAADAASVIAEILGRGRLPVLVGGTFLYFRALTEGFSPMPGRDCAVRAEIRARAARAGWEALHRELAACDPASAARIHPNDAQRIERALELHRLSGKAPSRLHAASGNGAQFDFVKFAVLPADRAALAERLQNRFDAMLAAGLVDEVRALHARNDLGRGLPAVRALGYRQLWGWLEGEYDYSEACRRAVVATRRYAKRQLTWLRREPECEKIYGNVTEHEPSLVQPLEQLYARLSVTISAG